MYRPMVRKYRSIQGHPCESNSNYCKESMIFERYRKLSQSHTRVPDSYDQYMTIKRSKEVTPI